MNVINMESQYSSVMMGSGRIQTHPFNSLLFSTYWMLKAEGEMVSDPKKLSSVRKTHNDTKCWDPGLR